jgi:hypothetical protein
MMGRLLSCSTAESSFDVQRRQFGITRMIVLFVGRVHCPYVWTVNAAAAGAPRSGNHFRLAYSFFASIKTGKSASASFHSARKS